MRPLLLPSLASNLIMRAFAVPAATIVEHLARLEPRHP